MSTSAKYAALGQPDDRTTAEWIADLVRARQAAESEVERLRATVARVEALADEWDRVPWRIDHPAAALRAVLAGGVAADAPTSSAGGVRCHAARDGECSWSACPQLRDGEPGATGRHCPIDDGDGEL